MATILPSDVVTVLLDNYPWVRGNQQRTTLTGFEGIGVAAVLQLLDELNPACLPQDRDDYSAYIQCVASLRQLVKSCEQQGGGTVYWPFVRRNNALTTLWLLLQKCPDEPISESVDGLEFIPDEGLRQSIRIDISTAESAFSNGEWKAATVFAAVAMEALLLWAILPERSEAKGKNWRLPMLIREARILNKIKDETVQQAELAGDYRNLVHPGKEEREQRRCNRATALGALSGLEFVINDLSQPES